MKRLYLSIAMAAISSAMMADGIKTAGNGTTYTLTALAQLEGSGITVQAEEADSEQTTFLFTANDTIAEGDKFVMDDHACVKFAQGVSFVIEGEADFRVENAAYFQGLDGDTTPKASILIKNGEVTTEFSNCQFRYVGLESMSAGKLHVSHCSFFEHDGSTAAALYFITAGQKSTIENCYFEECQKAAIGSAASASQSLLIKECQLVKNSRANNNVPQINIAAAESIQILDCEVAGDAEDPEANNMVGGIGISNFMGFTGTHVTIRNCDIAWNRYGIGTVGPVSDVCIEDCLLLENNHEANPMNGGSGVSLYDPYQQTFATLQNNHIEGNCWGVTIIGCEKVSLGDMAMSDLRNRGGNVFKDNGFDGQLYDLYNNSANTVYAQNNTWNVDEQTEEEIEKVIYHKHDDESLGEVIFWPAAGEVVGIDATPRQTSGAQPSYDLRGIPTVPAGKHGIHVVNGKKVVR